MNNEFSTLITNIDVNNEKDNNSVLILILDDAGHSIFTKFFIKDLKYDEQLIYPEINNGTEIIP